MKVIISKPGKLQEKAQTIENLRAGTTPTNPRNVFHLTAITFRHVSPRHLAQSKSTPEQEQSRSTYETQSTPWSAFGSRNRRFLCRAAGNKHGRGEHKRRARLCDRTHRSYAERPARLARGLQDLS